MSEEQYKNVLANQLEIMKALQALIAINPAIGGAGNFSTRIVKTREIIYDKGSEDAKS